MRKILTKTFLCLAISVHSSTHTVCECSVIFHDSQCSAAAVAAAAAVVECGARYTPGRSVRPPGNVTEDPDGDNAIEPAASLGRVLHLPESRQDEVAHTSDVSQTDISFFAPPQLQWLTFLLGHSARLTYIEVFTLGQFGGHSVDFSVATLKFSADVFQGLHFANPCGK